MNRQRKRAAATALAVTLAVGNVTTAFAGWYQSGPGGWQYQTEDQSVKTSQWFQDTDGKWYHFNEKGVMDTGWIKETVSVSNGGSQDRWYYLNLDGSMKTGWFQDKNASWYYLDQSGSMKTGWLQDGNGRWYFFASSGAMQTGLHEIDGNVYYFQSSGEMFTGQMTLEGKNYVFGQYGAENGRPATANKWHGNGQPISTQTAGTSGITSDETGNDQKPAQKPEEKPEEKPDQPSEPSESDAVREVFNFNTGWKFSKGVGKDNNESEVASKDVVVIPETEKPYEVDYEMGENWSDVSLPHTYNDIDTFDNFMEEEGSHHGERSMYTGTAWYKKNFTVPEEYRDKKVFLEFEAARQAAHIYINGQLLEGVSENGFIPFGYDLTPYLKFGQENQITVMVDNSFPYYAEGTTDALSWHDSHWHPTHGGLYRNANLYVTDKLHVTLPLYSFLETQGVYVYTSDESEESATVHIETEIQNEYDEPKTFQYAAQILDMDESEVTLVQSENVTLAPGETTQVKLTAEVEDPLLWSDEYPYLYSLMSQILVDGEKVDEEETTFGIRVFRFTNDFGMYLNENYTKLHGWGQKSTNEWAGLGAAYPDWMHEFVIQLMKDGGGNFIRWGHTAGSPTQIELSDKLGLIVEQPGVDGEGSTVGGVYSDTAYEVRKNAFRDMLIYYRNSPSIFMWELGNQSMPDKEAKALSDLVAQYDHHGKGNEPRENAGSYDETTPSSQRVTAVRRGNSTMAKYVDVGITTEGSGGMNTAAMGNKPEVEGEYNREEARRGVWDRYTEGFEDFKADSDYYNLTSEQFAVNQIENYKKISKVSHNGGANWIFSDSTSHGRVYSEVTRASGEVDAVMLEKEAYYALKTVQTDEVDAHIIGHWNYAAGTVKPVYVASDADRVELFLNGRSLGNGVKSNTYLFTFNDVAYEPGTLEAVGYDADGKEVCRVSKTTHGEPAAIRLTPIEGPQGLLANGSDVLLIDAEVVDSEGNRCLNYDGQNLGKKITFTINDENGCSIWRGGYNSGVEHSTNEKSLYIEAGITRVAVRTTTRPGTITVTASIDGLEADSICVESEAVDNENGLSTVFNETAEYDLDALTYPGMGDGTKPEEVSSVKKGYTSLLVDNFSYSGTGTNVKAGVVNPAAKGKSVYTDEKLKFGDLPLYLVNEDYFQLPNVDAKYQAEDMVSFGALQDITVYVAHDDRLDVPEWLNGEIQGISFGDSGEDITIGEETYSLFVANVAKGESVTLSGNAVAGEKKDGNMYVVFVTVAGEEDAFFVDDFEKNAANGSLSGWNVVTAENTSVTTVESEDGIAVSLYDTNTNAEDGLAYITKEFLPQTGKFSVEWKVYDNRMSGQNYVRFILNDGAADSDPTNSKHFVAETYLNTGGALIYKNSSASNVSIAKNLPEKEWYTIKYVVDMREKTFDVYIDGELAKAGCTFRNPDAESISCLIIGTGVSKGSDIMVDDVKIEVLEDRLESIQINGEVYFDFTITDDNAITLRLSDAFDWTQNVEMSAKASDYYAQAEVEKLPENAQDTAMIRVTPLFGDAVTYTVGFEQDAPQEEELDLILEETFEGFDAGENFLQDSWNVLANEKESVTAKIVADETGNALQLKDSDQKKTTDYTNMATAIAAFAPQSGKMAVEFRVKDLGGYEYFRIILHDGEPDASPTNKSNFALESYLHKGSLYYRDSTDKNKEITAISKNTWYTVKYMIDIEEHTFDVYLNGQLKKSGLRFRNDLDTIDHITFATGAIYLGDVLLDDIRIYGKDAEVDVFETQQPLVDDIQVDGESIPDFDCEQDTYEVQVDADTQEVEVSVATASEAVRVIAINETECKKNSAIVELEEDVTEITVCVQTKDGDEAVYTIVVTKEEAEEEKEEIELPVEPEPIQKPEDITQSEETEKAETDPIPETTEPEVSKETEDTTRMEETDEPQEEPTEPESSETLESEEAVIETETTEGDVF